MSDAETMDARWPPQDYRAVQKRIQEIVAAADELSKFEGDFLTELLRMATKFKSSFRMTPKQIEVMDQLHLKFAFKNDIAAKVKKPSAGSLPALPLAAEEVTDHRADC
jgi:hypothetical protein